MTESSIAIPGLLQGHLVLVTGAGQGNGRAIALGVARSGARVIVTDILARHGRGNRAGDPFEWRRGQRFPTRRDRR